MTTPPAKTGRPREIPSVGPPEVVSARVPTEVRRELEHRAGEAGVSLGRYVRGVLVEHVGGEADAGDEDDDQGAGEAREVE